MAGLRELREARGLSQRELARQAKVAFRTVQLVEAGHHDARSSTLGKLARTLGLDDAAALLRGGSARMRLTAAEAASHIRAEGEASWKLWLFELVDEFQRRPDASLLARAPDPDVSPRVLALLASMAESLCARRALRPPWWCGGVAPLARPWFPAGVESLKAAALVESPAAFRQRNIFVLGNFLARA